MVATLVLREDASIHGILENSNDNKQYNFRGSGFRFGKYIKPVSENYGVYSIRLLIGYWSGIIRFVRLGRKI